jgi:hypothetical protein
LSFGLARHVDLLKAGFSAHYCTMPSRAHTAEESPSSRCSLPASEMWLSNRILQTVVRSMPLKTK